MARAYLDHASSSPLRPAARDAMLPFLAEHHGDPGRLHAEGRTARAAIEHAREQVAALFGARAREVVFTGSGTEAVNTAVNGVLARAGTGHIVTTAVEHSSVLDACARADGFAVAHVGVDRRGRFDPDAVVAAIGSDTVLVSVQLANHEVGTLQDVAPIVEQARDRGVAVHLDACAAAGYHEIAFTELGADLCSVTAHKLGGPTGIGALLVRRGLRFPPLVVGGAQERERRAGAENTPAIVGFGAAAEELLGGGLAAEATRTRSLATRLAAASTATVEGVERLGDPDLALPHIVCLGIAGVEAVPVLLGLDQRGVAVHSGSSCSSESLEPSPVLAAMGVDADRSLRVSLGWSSTEDEVDAFCAALPEVVGGLRQLRR